MDSLSLISGLVQALGGVGSLVVLVILWRAGLLGNSSSVEPKVDQMIEYYNHNVTERDGKLLDGQERMQKTLEEMLSEQRAHNELDKEVLREIKNMKEYGLPCRDKKP